ncbi:MAG: hypothetical protein ISR46_05900 [Rhodospirillales bacterium]|nr:hypothetical protein [Rhodospirillales bacterium]
MKNRLLFPVLMFGLLLGCVTESANTPTLKLKDNLLTKPRSMIPMGFRIVETLKKFESAFEAGNKDQLASLFPDDFQHLQIQEGEIIGVENLESFANGAGGQLEFYLSHIKKDKNSGLIYAAAVMEKNGKYFSEKNWAVFTFDEINTNQIKGIMSSSIYFSKYPKDNISIFFMDNVNFRQVEQAFNSKNVDEAMDEIVKGNLNRFIAEQDLAALVIFKTPPKPESIIRIEYLFQSSERSKSKFKYEYKQEGFGPYVALTNSISSHRNAGSITAKVYVDDILVGEKTIYN